MTDDLPALFNSDKTFAVRPVWRQRDANWFQCVQALDIDGVTVEGLRFRATAKIDRPDESVTFQIEYRLPNRAHRGGPLARVEWKPFSPHNNKGRGPLHLRHILQTGSHVHHFQQCWELNETEVRNGNLPLSEPITPEPTWDEILVFVGKEFRISPIDWIPYPPWKPALV